jgi:hypothetical protein
VAASTQATSPDVRADFNHDGYGDLAVGTPFESVGTIHYAGAVSVLYGAAGRLTRTGSQLFTQVGSAVEVNDHFGTALAAGDFNSDGFGDLGRVSKVIATG